MSQALGHSHSENNSNNNSGIFQHPTLTNGQVIETESKQRYNEINRGYEKMDFKHIYRTFHPKTKEYTFFSAPHGTFSKINHIIGPKTTLNRYKIEMHLIRSPWPKAKLQ